ncbi:hypothetical protein KJ780_02310, partial [Candidatus Micrarchaeota archaeon]|nr:hypothetical protein [Candidatus Micrarchaeota archaeon]
MNKTVHKPQMQGVPKDPREVSKFKPPPDHEQDLLDILNGAGWSSKDTTKVQALPEKKKPALPGEEIRKLLITLQFKKVKDAMIENPANVSCAAQLCGLDSMLDSRLA